MATLRHRRVAICRLTVFEIDRRLTLNFSQDKIDRQQGPRGLLGKDGGNVADVTGFIPDRVRSQGPDGETDQGHGHGDADKGASDDGSDDQGTIRDGFAK
jgi:hypothetical protein